MRAYKKRKIGQNNSIICQGLLADLSPSLDESDVNRLCRSVSGGVVCYSGDHVGSVAVYFCKLEGDTTRQCLSSGHWKELHLCVHLQMVMTFIHDCIST